METTVNIFFAVKVFLYFDIGWQKKPCGYSSVIFLNDRTKDGGHHRR